MFLFQISNFKFQVVMVKKKFEQGHFDPFNVGCCLKVKKVSNFRKLAKKNFFFCIVFNKSTSNYDKIQIKICHIKINTHFREQLLIRRKLRLIT